MGRGRICIKLYFLQCNNTNHTKLWTLKVSIVLKFYVYANSILVSRVVIIKSLYLKLYLNNLESKSKAKLYVACIFQKCQALTWNLSLTKVLKLEVYVSKSCTYHYSDSLPFSFPFSISYFCHLRKIWNRFRRCCMYIEDRCF